LQTFETEATVTISFTWRCDSERTEMFIINWFFIKTENNIIVAEHTVLMRLW